MKKHQHCNICQNIDARISEGIFCGLNGERPNFKDLCPNFNLSLSSQLKLEELVTEMNIIKVNQKEFKSNFYFLVIVGTIITIVGFYFFEFNHKSIYLTKFSSLICGIGLTFWTIALQRKNSLSRKRKQINKRINDFEQVLKNYK